MFAKQKFFLVCMCFINSIWLHAGVMHIDASSGWQMNVFFSFNQPSHKRWCFPNQEQARWNPDNPEHDLSCHVLVWIIRFWGNWSMWLGEALQLLSCKHTWLSSRVRHMCVHAAACIFYVHLEDWSWHVGVKTSLSCPSGFHTESYNG